MAFHSPSAAVPALPFAPEFPTSCRRLRTTDAKITDHRRYTPVEKHSGVYLGFRKFQKYFSPNRIKPLSSPSDLHRFRVQIPRGRGTRGSDSEIPTVVVRPEKNLARVFELVAIQFRIRLKTSVGLARSRERRGREYTVLDTRRQS